MSSRNGLGKLYDRLTPEERFRLDVLAMARGDMEESELLTRTCPRRPYTMNEWGFSARWHAARELAMLTYMDLAKCLDKLQMIEAFRVALPYFRKVWVDDTHDAYFDGHEAGSRHAWSKAGMKGEPPGYEADEDERVESVDPAIEEGIREWTGKIAEIDAPYPRLSTGSSARWPSRALAYGRHSPAFVQRRWEWRRLTYSLPSGRLGS
jgi:hypothetical protein